MQDRDSERRQGGAWVIYPGGLRLAAEIISGGFCSACGNEAGERHAVGCAEERCPKCGGFLARCGCRSKGDGLETMSARELERVIDAAATEYLDLGTWVSIKNRAGGDRLAKARAFRRMADNQRAANRILRAYPDGQVDAWRRESRAAPETVRQAFIMERRARRIWIEWAAR